MRVGITIEPMPNTTGNIRKQKFRVKAKMIDSPDCEVYSIEGFSIPVSLAGLGKQIERRYKAEQAEQAKQAD